MSDDADVSSEASEASDPEVVSEESDLDVETEPAYRNDGVSPHAVLGLFMILVAGGIALSIVTAPPVAREQLHAAAANTAAASSFVLVDSTVVTTTGAGGAAGTVVGRNRVSVVYQAPDKVSETRAGSSGSVSVIEIGAKSYERVSGSKWVQLPSTGGAGGSQGGEAAEDLLLPLQSLTAATGVVRSGQTYRFDPGDLPELLATFGLETSDSRPVSTSFSATVSGENATSLRIAANLGAHQAVIDLAYDSIGTAPAVTAPPAGDLISPAKLPTTGG